MSRGINAKFGSWAHENDSTITGIVKEIIFQEKSSSDKEENKEMTHLI